MALLKRKEFAQLCGKSEATINVYIARGNIIPSGRFINTSLPDNILQMEKWGVDSNSVIIPPAIQEPTPKKVDPKKKESKPVRLKVSKPKKPDPKQKEVEEIPVPDYSKKKQPNYDAPPDYSRVPTRTELDAEKIQAEIEYKREATINKALANSKLRGESIPTVMVVEVIASLGAGLQNAYKTGADALILELSHKYKLPPSALSELKMKLIKLVNTSHDKGIKIAKKNLKTIISNVKAIEVENAGHEE